MTFVGCTTRFRFQFGRLPTKNPFHMNDITHANTRFHVCIYQFQAPFVTYALSRIGELAHIVVQRVLICNGSGHLTCHLHQLQDIQTIQYNKSTL